MQVLMQQFAKVRSTRSQLQFQKMLKRFSGPAAEQDLSTMQQPRTQPILQVQTILTTEQ